ncbi:hypothetical protein RFH42_01295 [Acinetobacter rudis]|uniref:hypothetical protein n=1 Tax=Acinetobacter rudis TaxID=632955 RepID=UPI00280D0CD1|nr:hypothetical protein [Acinetobacter rudis]MDQ8951598.1 hypothetical protein [Acinetobacter rudis]
MSLLIQMGIHQSSYSLDRIRNSECISVLKQKEEWHVYYTERNKPELLFSSKIERDAYEFIANQFEKWRL